MQSHSQPRAVLRALLALGAVCAAVQAAEPPNDPAFPWQWSLHNSGQVVGGAAGTPGADIGMLGAWDIHRGSRWVRVAVVSSGLSAKHITGLSEGIATTGDRYDVSDSHGAGSHAASVLAEWTGDGMGIAGIHERIDLIPIRTFDGPLGTPATVADGIREAVRRRAEIILVSAAFANTTPDLDDAVTEAAATGILIIAPVGDDASPSVHFPARHPDCIAVTATNHRDEKIANANTGSEVELAAPGWQIPADDGTTPDALRSGTAVAAAHVAGVAALMRSYDPSLTAPEIRDVLAASAADLGDPDRDETFGFGRVRADVALSSTPEPLLRIVNVRDDVRQTHLVPGDPGQEVQFRLDGTTETANLVSARVRYRHVDAGDFHELPLHSDMEQHDAEEGALFSATWPVFACGDSMEYYAEFVAQSGGEQVLLTEPPDAPASLFRISAGAPTPLAYFDFHSDDASEGWTTDPEAVPSIGTWTRGDPDGAGAQPAFDASTTDESCFYTGRANGGDQPFQHDVDGGPMWLQSPSLAAAGFGLFVSARVWLVSEGEGVPDQLVLEYSSDGGDSWNPLREWSAYPAWRESDDWIPWTASGSASTVALRWSVSDEPNDSLTEAAVDEVRIVEDRCAPLAWDVDGDRRFGLPEFADLFGELSAPPASGSASCAERFREGGLQRSIDLRDFGCLQRWFGVD